MDKIYLEEAINSGKSINIIAKDTMTSLTNVRYWLKKYGLKSQFKSFKDGYKPKTKAISFCKSCSSTITGKGKEYCSSGCAAKRKKN